MRTSRQDGLTAIEVLLVTLLLPPLVGGSLAVLASSSGVQVQCVSGSLLERNAAVAVDRIAQEIVLAGANTFYPAPASPFSTERVDFEVPVASSDEDAPWGELRGIELVPMPDDPDDGLDNDGDGLVDECQVVGRRGPRATPISEVVLVHHVREYLEGESPNGADDNGNGLVDERGLCLVRSGDVWTVLLTLERRDSDGRVHVQTVTTSANPRNAK